MNEDNPAIATISHHWLSPSQPLPLLRSLSSPWPHPLRSLQGRYSLSSWFMSIFLIFSIELKLVVYGFGVLDAMAADRNHCRSVETIEPRINGCFEIYVYAFIFKSRLRHIVKSVSYRSSEQYIFSFPKLIASVFKFFIFF